MTEIILTSSVLIVFLAAMRRLLRRHIPPTVQYALWLLVAARLLIPGTLFTVPVSVMGAAEDLQSAIEAWFPGESIPSASPNGFSTPLPSPIPPERTEDYGDTVVTYYPPQATAPTPTRSVNWIDVIWKAGMALTGIALLLSDITFYISLRRGRKRLPDHQLPRPCRVPVYVVESLPSPCLFGLLHPSIYLNESALAPQRIEHILTHEETHLRRGDHLWALLRSLCLAVHWYDPLVWWAAALSRRDCELSCDAASIRRLGEEQRIGYGETLVSMVLPQTSPSELLRTATTMTAEKRTMLERIQLIAQRPPASKAVLAPAAAAIAAVVILTFGGGAKPLPDTEASTPPSASMVPEDTVQPTPQPAAPAPIQTASSTFTHPTGIFSFSFPESMATSLTWHTTSTGLALYALEDDPHANSWLLRIVPQPTHWLEDNPSTGVTLGAFAANSTPHTYLLEYDAQQVSPESVEQISGSFQLHIDSGLIAQLANRYQEDKNMAELVSILPYLSWRSYRDAYGEDQLFSLLCSLWEYASEGGLTWSEVHNVLSVPPDEALDGAYATAYEDMIWALYQPDPQQFASVFFSEYISDSERANALRWLRFNMGYEEGRQEGLTETQALSRLRAHLADASADPPPFAFSTLVAEQGSFGLIAFLEGRQSWTIESLQDLLTEQCRAALVGSQLENCLDHASISPAFLFPDAPQSGQTLRVPVTWVFRTAVSGQPFYASSEEVVCEVGLYEEGGEMPTQMLYDLAQAAKMAAMDRYGLEQCAAFPEVLSVPFSRETFDVALHIRETVVHKLEADGLSQRWTLTAVECGSHRIPSHEPPGTVQAITYSVTFTQLSEGSESHTVSGTLTVLTA